MKENRIKLRNCIYLIVTTTLIVTAALVMSFYSTEPAAPKTYTVEIAQMQFRPALLEAHKGDTVIFVNKDIVDHDATEVNKAWHSPPLSTGESWKWVATKSSDYYCSIHLIMKGQIIVN